MFAVICGKYFSRIKNLNFCVNQDFRLTKELEKSYFFIKKLVIFMNLGYKI